MSDNSLSDFLYCPVCGSEDVRIEISDHVETVTNAMLDRAITLRVGPRCLRVYCGRCGHSVEGFWIDSLLSEWNSAERRPRR